MRYRQLSNTTSQDELERETIEFWGKENVFQKVQDATRDFPPFVFYEGPPTANGKPGVHHIICRTVKDVVCRFRTMTGHFVERKAGWDTHGLPIEIEVEKQFGFKGKKDIERYGIDKFNKACRESVFKYLDEWVAITRRIGYWLDIEHPYITCDNSYIESIWWLLAQFFKKGMIYHDHKVVPYCPRCGTGLSDHEVAQGYRDTEDPSVYIRFKKLDSENTYFLVWTTTPWTLLSNVALAVHPKETYYEIEHNGEHLILVKQRAEALFGEDVKPIHTFKGSEMVGWRYEPLFRFVEPDKDAWRVVDEDYVTVEDGTGIVHIAPAFGQEDFAAGKRHDLPLVQLVEPDGSISKAATPFAGMWFKDADPLIMDDLKKRRLLFDSGTVVHSYPFCWRCDSPLLQYARGTWYIRTTAYKDKLIEENGKIRWFPKTVGTGRFGEWLENNVDWALSRERYWGTPLNIWICESCGKQHSVDSIADLKKMARGTVPDNIDLHRPYVDDIELICPDCGGVMRRVPEVIDCWFDSGGMPFAQVHYPFEHKDDFEKRYFPADFIAEAVDQTRGWFYTLLAISAFITGRSSYKDVAVIGLILDAKGKKMSKHIGNVVSPDEIIPDYGADPLRWFLLSNSQPYLPTKMDISALGDVKSKVFDTLRNLYNFFSTYGNIDDFEPAGLFNAKLTLIDKWLISRLNTLVKNINIWLENYDMTRATRAIGSFVLDEFSNWYVRRSRRRFWGSGMTPDKKAAYETMHYTMMTLMKLIAPFAPMTADAYYRLLAEGGGGFKESVHLESFPKADESAIDAALEEHMALGLRLAQMGRSARSDAMLKVRQPLSVMYVKGASIELAPELINILKDELNIRSVEPMPDDLQLYKLAAKPNYRTLGPRFGSRMKEIADIILHLPESSLSKIETGENIHIEMDGKSETLTPDDIIIEHQPNPDYAVGGDDELSIAIDTRLTDELITEGLARELVNRIQNTRKNAGFDVSDRIETAIEASDAIVAKVSAMADYIASETLSANIEWTPSGHAEYSQKWKIGTDEIVIHISKIKGG